MTDPFGFFRDDSHLAIFHGVAKREAASDPDALLLGGCNLVPDALRSNFPFELSKGQENVEGQASHGRRGIELLGDRDKRDAMSIEQLDQFGEVGERTGQAVDLVNTMTSILRARISSSRCCSAGQSVDPPEKPPSS
jgi:hypothetical protein